VTAPGPCPPPLDENVRARMRAVHGTGTGPELAVLRRVRAAGYRPAVNRRVGLPGRFWRPDLSWKTRRLAVYVDGCFWHGCPQHCRPPVHNGEWWRTKLLHNVLRDRAATRELTAAGWTVLRFWEHEDPDIVVAEIVENLNHY
jgi:DNA mismatch endonuclease (patch repair protein)